MPHDEPATGHSGQQFGMNAWFWIDRFRSAGPLSDRSPGRFPSRLDGWSEANRRVPAENFEHPRLVNLPPRRSAAVRMTRFLRPESAREAGRQACRKFWRLHDFETCCPPFCL